MRLTLLSLLVVIGSMAYAQDAEMSLEECVNLALENNLNIKRAELNLETAEADLKEAEFSRYPDLNAGAGYQVNWGRSIDPTSNQFTTQRINSFGLNSTSNVLLFNAFNIQNSIEQSERILSATQYDVEKSSNDVMLDVVTFYLNVIFNQELVENARFQLQSTQEQLDRTKILVESGTLPISNELQLESQVATNEVDLINAQNSLNLAILALKQTMLLLASEPLAVLRPEADVELMDFSISSDDVFIDAQTVLPEIKAADLRVRGAEYGYQSSVARLYPSLTLTAGVSTNFSSAAKPFDPSFDNTTWTFGEQISDNLSQFVAVGLNIPIFNGYSGRLDVQRSKVAIQQAEVNAQEQRNFLRQTIETAYNDAIAASKSFEAATSQVQALEETFRTVERQYNLGASNFTEYQVASNNLFQARSDLTRTKFDYIFKKKLLDFYQGNELF